MRLSLSFLASVLPTAQFFRKTGDNLVSALEVAGDHPELEVSVAFDSRLLQKGDFFIALKGQTVDGHAFITDVLHAGAVGLLISDRSALESPQIHLWRGQLIVLVHDTKEAFIALARAWRRALTIPIVAITGSVGKTTTKEMLASILHAAGVNALVSVKNQNTVVGICTTILNIKTTHAVAVCEVGISLKGEMSDRIDILRPTIAVITNVGHAHVAGLGGLAGVAFEKRQIFKFFEPHYIGIINGDQSLLSDAYYFHPVAKFGFKTKNQVQARKITIKPDPDGQLKMSFTLKCYGEKADIELHVGHQGYVSNALAACATAYFLKIPFKSIVKGLNEYQGCDARFQLFDLKQGTGKLISDCYNANPESMRAAIEAFGQMFAGSKKIAVIGDMLELGDKEIFWNRQVGRMFTKIGGVDEVILVGKLAAAAAHTMPFRTKVATVETWKDAVPLLEKMVKDDVAVLVKGSRGVGLKALVDLFV